MLFISMIVIPMKKNTSDIKGFNKIIAPVDGSKGATKAVQKALVLAKQTGQTLVAIYVVDTPRLTETIPADDISVAWEELLKKEGQKVLDNIERQAKKMGVSIQKKLVEGIPEEVIMKEAKKDDLIVMGCKGKSAMDRILMGSVCEKVTRHASSQVMVIR
jgi:nucleotide-binding universal stress UspA family protein